MTCHTITAMRYLLLAIIALICLRADADVWTLDSCINYATSHNINVRLGEVNTSQAEQSLEEARSGYLPNVSANAGQSWNLGRGLTSQNTYANRNTSSFNWGVSASVPVFDGLRTPRRIDYAKANLSRIIENHEAAKEDVSINVISAYLQVLYTQELLAAARQQVTLSEYELTRRQALVEAGKLPEIDILEAKSLLANDRLSEVQAQNNFIMAKIDLTRLLDLDIDISSFDVAPVADQGMALASPEDTFEKALQCNHSVIASKKGIEASDANIKLSKTGYIPTLSFNAGVGSTYYKVSGFDNESFGSQMRHNYSTYFGLSLNIPIFDGFSTRNSIRQAKVEKLNAELQLEQTTDQLQRTINEVYYQAAGAYEKLKASSIAEEFASKAFEATREKYNLGKATSADYEQSKTKSIQAKTDLIQAAYEYLLRLRLLNFYSTPH